MPFDDRGARLLGIPLVALAITLASGVLGPYGPASPRFWAGCAWFVTLSAVLWHLNRRLIVRSRSVLDWLEQPWRRLSWLLAGNVLTTVPLAVLAHVAWYRIAALPLDGRRIGINTLVIVASVVLVTQAYETVYLIRQRQADVVAAGRLERERLQAELEALRSHVDPHFLFNALSALVELIPRDARRAVAFVERLGAVYRHVVSTRGRALVPLAEELRFADEYLELLRLRFGDAVRVRSEGLGEAPLLLVAPVSLQVLLENAVKHNVIRAEDPLEIRLAVLGDRIEVSNRRRSQPARPVSLGTGLRDLDERCRRTVGRGIEVRADARVFAVALPLARQS
jgi:sensor histidine kinase YesM